MDSVRLRLKLDRVRRDRLLHSRPSSFVWFFFLFVVLSLTAAHKRWKRRHLHSSFFLFVVVLLFLFDSSLWNVSLFLHAPRV
jgi:hypothetical protein